MSDDCENKDDDDARQVLKVYIECVARPDGDVVGLGCILVSFVILLCSGWVLFGVRETEGKQRNRIDGLKF